DPFAFTPTAQTGGQTPPFPCGAMRGEPPGEGPPPDPPAAAVPGRGRPAPPPSHAATGEAGGGRGGPAPSRAGKRPGPGEHLRAPKSRPGVSKLAAEVIPVAPPVSVEAVPLTRVAMQNRISAEFTPAQRTAFDDALAAMQ